MKVRISYSVKGSAIIIIMVAQNECKANYKSFNI